MTAPAKAEAAVPVLVKCTKHIAVTVTVGSCRKYTYSSADRWNMNKCCRENVFIPTEEYKLPAIRKPSWPSG